MAKLMLIGKVAQVELTHPEFDQTEYMDQILAKCRLHPSIMRDTGKLCGWSETYDDMNDATEYAAGHADGAR